jgi:hypothetical protein
VKDIKRETSMQTITIPDHLPLEGLKIPLRAAFTGPKSTPLIAMYDNSIFPLLKLYEDGLEFRVFIKRRKSYADIERVLARQRIWTDNVSILWKDSVFAFTANVRGKELLQELLRFLQRRGVPLGESATRVLQKTITA